MVINTVYMQPEHNGMNTEKLLKMLAYIAVVLRVSANITYIFRYVQCKIH